MPEMQLRQPRSAKQNYLLSFHVTNNELII